MITCVVTTRVSSPASGAVVHVLRYYCTWWYMSLGRCFLEHVLICGTPPREVPRVWGPSIRWANQLCAYRSIPEPSIVHLLPPGFFWGGLAHLHLLEKATVPVPLTHASALGVIANLHFRDTWCALEVADLQRAPVPTTGIEKGDSKPMYHPWFLIHNYYNMPLLWHHDWKKRCIHQLLANGCSLSSEQSCMKRIVYRNFLAMKLTTQHVLYKWS